MLLAQLLFVIGRHQRLTEALDDLRLWLANRVANIIFVGLDRLPALQFHLTAEKTGERRPLAALRVRAVARGTALRLEKLLTRDDRRFLIRATRQPLVKIIWLHHDDPARHARM